MLLLRCAGKIWDTVCGAGVLFGADFARYTGRAGDIRTVVTVRVPPKGMWKEIELELTNEGEETAEVQAAYYTEPVLGVDRRFARHIKARWEDGGLLLRQPFGGVKGTMLLTAEGGADGCDCDRGSFLAGQLGRRYALGRCRIPARRWWCGGSCRPDGGKGSALFSVSPQRSLRQYSIRSWYSVYQRIRRLLPDCRRSHCPTNR